MMPVAKCPQDDQKARADLEERHDVPPWMTPGRALDLHRPG